MPLVLRLTRACLLLLLISITELYGQNTGNRIVGGEPVAPGDIPYQISLRRSWNHNHFCGGSLITDRHVLSAAHCMFYAWGGLLPPYTIAMVAGQIEQEVTNSSVLREPTLITLHPNYNRSTYENDIAVLEVSEPFVLNILILPVELRQNAINSGRCLVSGWGYQEYDAGYISEVLLAAEVEIVDFPTCFNSYYDNSNGSIILVTGMLCAGHSEGKTDACDGDSGGPLVCDGLLTGLVSTGRRCAEPDFPGIYADVAYYYEWIKAQLNTASTPDTQTAEITTTENSSFIDSKEVTYNSQEENSFPIALENTTSETTSFYSTSDSLGYETTTVLDMNGGTTYLVLSGKAVVMYIIFLLLYV